jgi:hypothetical protein
MFAWSSSRSFRNGKIRDGPFATPSCSLGFDPWSRSDLITEQFPDTPEVIGESCCHSWRKRTPVLLGGAQFMMRPTEIRGTPDQIPSCLQCLKTMGGMPTFAGEGSETFTHGLGKDTARHDLFRPYVSASSPPNEMGYRRGPSRAFFVTLFPNRTGPFLCHPALRFLFPK